MSSTIKALPNLVTRTSEEAIDLLYNSDHHDAILIAISQKKLDEMVAEVIAEVKRRNTTIKDIGEQMLPSMSYSWDDIDGCLGVKCVEIGIGKFETAAELLHIGCEPVYSALTDPNARKPLSIKALTSLAMLGYLSSGG